MLILSVFCPLRKNYSFFFWNSATADLESPFSTGSLLLTKAWMCSLSRVLIKCKLINQGLFYVLPSLWFFLMWSQKESCWQRRWPSSSVFCLQQWSIAGIFQELKGLGKYVKILRLQSDVWAFWIEEGVIFLSQLWSLENSLVNTIPIGLCFSICCVTCLTESV